MAEVIEEPVAVVSDPSLIEVKLFNRWSFDDVQVIIFFLTFLQFHLRFDLITFQQSVSLN